MKLRSKVMQNQATRLCLIAVATLVASCAGADGAVCERGRSWWDRQRGACMPCTRCDPSRHQAVRVPCELHRNTVCQSIYELNIWPFLKRNNSKVAQNEDLLPSAQIGEYSVYEDYVDYDQVVESVNDEEWDLQTMTFIVAASGCVVFFVVVLLLTFYHTKQWRKLRQALQSDVQDLSAKLKLMEAGTEPVGERIRSTDHHIYSNVHVSKDTLLASATASGKLGFGNVYTEE